MTKKNTSRVSIRHTAKAQPERIHEKSASHLKHMFLVVSSKNGVGKTSITLNIALAFSKKGLKTGLLDLDIYRPNICRMLGIEQPFEPDSTGRFTPWAYSDNLKVAAIEPMLLNIEDMQDRRQPAGTADIQRFIHNINWGSLDYLIADTPPGSGKGLRSVIRSMPDAKIIIVSAPNKISAEQAKKMINFFRKEKIQVFGWIENMRGFLCQNCNQRQELFSTGAGNRAIFLMELPFLGRIPIDPHLEECSDAGEPYLEKYHNSEAAIAFNRIAEKILKLHAWGGTESNENHWGKRERIIHVEEKPAN
jgi:ATP-binding protein involved in chromosome partitioning